MKRICVVVLAVALLSVVSPAFAVIQAFKLGAVGTDTLAGTMYALASIAGAARYKTLESPVGTDYQVTAGYTLYITKIVWQANTAGQQITEIGYADNGVAEQVAAPTTPVAIIPYLYGEVTKIQTLEGLWKIPASKYPYYLSNVAATTVMIFGIEIAN